MKLIKSLLPVMVIPVIINCYTPAFAQDSNDIFGDAYLVRNPYFIDSCEVKTDANAILIIRQQKRFDKKGNIYIITHSQGAIEATLSRILDRCKPFFEKDEGDLGLLYTAKKIEWFSEIDALLAIKETKLSERKIGIVKQYSLDKKRSDFLNEIKKYIPKSDHIGIDNTLRFVLPETKTEYVFIGVSHFDPLEYEKAGDKALKTKGFIFTIEERIPKLLLEEDDMTGVFTVSKPANNAAYEILVSTSTVYQGSYELRFFDGQKFIADKIILYQWGH